tara:strand:- start:17368 stop:18552 length:1185 start_codon:yes stop_codon:yes gene_type:complete
MADMLRTLRFFAPRYFAISCVMLVLAAASGCQKTDPIVTYSIPTEMPEQLRTGNDRMLAAMVPKGDQTWFFKITAAPEKAVAVVEDDFRKFVESIQFEDDKPVLDELPEGWQLGGSKPMRFASIDVNTPDKQLDISVSSLPKQSDWDAEVAMNVNRWRGQVGLPASTEKWASGKPLEIESADGPAVWVDIVGKSSGGSPPMMGGMAGGPMAGGPMARGEMPNDDIHSGVAGGSMASGSSPSTTPASDNGAASESPASRLKYDRPEGWRDGRMSSMRMAAFNVGPEDAEAEITVIPAGGDLRGNVARWLGQIRPEGVADEVVDKALQDAEKVKVDGRDGQRFLLLGTDPEAGTAIDATIVPLDEGFSLFIKMTGPAKTVTAESEAIKSFLESIKL